MSVEKKEVKHEENRGSNYRKRQSTLMGIMKRSIIYLIEVPEEKER